MAYELENNYLGIKGKKHIMEKVLERKQKDETRQDYKDNYILDLFRIFFFIVS